MKVMNGLAITLEEDRRFLYVWLLYYVSNFPESYFMRSFVFLSVFSSSEVLSKITSIRSKLPTAACWSREEKRGNCEANLLYVEGCSENAECGVRSAECGVRSAESKKYLKKIKKKFLKVRN